MLTSRLQSGFEAVIRIYAQTSRIYLEVIPNEATADDAVIANDPNKNRTITA